jgi:hypothetical protein
VQFNSGTYLQVDGTLTANGTSAAPILFTANTPTPTRGYWGAIVFTQSSSAASKISFATIEYTGVNVTSALVSNTSGGAIVAVNASPAIDQVTIRQSSQEGIVIAGASATVPLSNSTITSNTGAGILLTDTKQGGLTQNGTSGGVTVTSTSITNNGDYALKTWDNGRFLGLTSVTITGNGAGSKNAIRQFGNIWGNMTWRNFTVPWAIEGLVAHTVGTLTIDPGTTVKMGAGAELQLAGNGGTDSTCNAFDHEQVVKAW